MSGSEQILKILEEMDIYKLLDIMKEAQQWVQSNPQQAHDELIDNPQLRYALFHIPRILEDRYKDIRSGKLELPQNNRQQKHPNTGSYRNQAMQGQFYDYQNADQTQTQMYSQYPMYNDFQQNYPPNNYPPNYPPQGYPPYNEYQPNYGSQPDYQGYQQQQQMPYNAYRPMYQQQEYAGYPPQPPPNYMGYGRNEQN
ncbi:hypothetical protein GPJ56_006824 [Histomonas meleagridis]|uniref:uncharacterized protein n=1 Tax=Histomonas meleagridis TaxID=135588 RepID=UPI00355977B0|nr:hypothetical protein GPJ56_006824 [Histomonas meleagridis]KAH0800231.1 hypothetical protein GO595_007343 [Histomonas meleagridis]